MISVFNQQSFLHPFFEIGFSNVKGNSIPQFNWDHPFIRVGIYLLDLLGTIQRVGEKLDDVGRTDQRDEHAHHDSYYDFHDRPAKVFQVVEERLYRTAKPFPSSSESSSSSP